MSKDTIYRADVVSEIHKYFFEEIDKTSHGTDEDGEDVYTDMQAVNSLLAYNKQLSKRIKALTSAHPDLDEWCYDCKEYDTENHCCPRWNRVIRETLKDAQSEPNWIPIEKGLPKKYGEYLVTFVPSAGTLWTYVVIAHYSDLMGIAKPCFHVGNVGKLDFQNITDGVTAYMPLPKPWEGKADEMC